MSNNSKSSKKNIKNDFSNNNIAKWATNHKIAYFDSMRALLQAPIANLLTMLILGIALALPVLLYLIILNASLVLATWQQDFYQYSIYLNSKVTPEQAITIQNNLAQWPEIERVNIISKEQGMAELKKILGIEEVLDNMENNPLPIVLVVALKSQYRNLDNIKALISKSNSIAGVVKADADITFLEKLINIFKMFSYVAYVFSLVLGVAILLVISNTIRLTLENKQQEMVLSSLLGATLAYIRRPYLYGGVLYGLFAGFIAYIVANLLFNKLYYILNDFGYTALSNVVLSGFNFSQIILLLLISGCLGWMGARITLYFQTARLQDRLGEI
ncbi:MAG: ABC transporter permease [Gammaproteobacteria bacterium]|nr:ABC transporter permease [Gammaproteobacteria bacterium]